MRGEYKDFKSLANLGRFKVPEYQREYVWKQSNFDDFVEDLIFYKDNPQYAFIGSIILKGKDNKGGTFEIVDGQQRLTSLTLFMIALTKRYEFLVGKNKNQKKIQSKIATLNVYRDLYLDTQNNFLPRLIPHADIQDGFNIISNIDWNPYIHEEHKEFFKRKDSISKAYREFEKLSEFFNKKTETTEKDLLEMMRLIANLDLVYLTAKTDEEAYYAFETTNSRGVELEVQDQLRNHIFSGVKSQKQKQQVFQRWKDCLNGITNPARMIRQYYFTRGGYISQKELYKKIKSLKDNQGNPLKGLDLMDEIEDYANFFKIVSFGDEKEFDGYLNNFVSSRIHHESKQLMFISIASLRDFKTTQTYPVIYSFLNTFKKIDKNLKKQNKYMKKDNLKIFFQNIERFLFINYKIGTNRANVIEAYAANLARDLNNTNSEAEFKKQIREFYDWLEKTKDNEDVFKSRFIELSYSSTALRDLRYIFSKHDTHFRLKNNEQISTIYDPNKKSSSKDDIEHWFPENPPANVIDIDSNIKNNIGNLITLYSKKNASLGNQSPEKKFLKIQKDKTKIDDRSAEEFLKKYGGNNFKDWDETNIKKRSEDMAIFSYKEVWKLDNRYIDSGLSKRKNKKKK